MLDRTFAVSGRLTLFTVLGVTGVLLVGCAADADDPNAGGAGGAMAAVGSAGGAEEVPDAEALEAAGGALGTPLEADAGPLDEPATDSGVEEEATDAGRESDIADPPDAAAAMLSGDRFADIYRDIFATNGCNSPYCHHGFSLEIPAGNAETAWQELLDARAESRPCGPETRQMRILVPGNPEASLLYLKVAPGVEVCGEKMPMSAGEIDGIAPELAERLRAWIAAGAPR